MSERALAVVWFVFGAAVAVASWRMDRLGDRGVEPWSAPGLTPGVIGVAIMAFALVVGWRARRASPSRDADGDAAAPGGWRRTALAAFLCVAFAGVSLGHGLPFVVEGAVFVFAFTTLFSWRAWRAEDRIARGLAQTLVIAAVAAAVVAVLFERVFLVRLP